MSTGRWVRLVVCGLITWGLGVSALPAQESDQPQEAGIEYPLQVIHCSGMDRFMEKAEALFMAAERPEMLDVLQSAFDNNLNSLAGLDRTKPFGMMLYIKPGITPGISAISYLPVADLDDLLRTLAGKEGQIRDVTGEDHQHELTETGWGPDVAIRKIGDYIFMADVADVAELQRKFPNPERLVSKLTSRYDVAYSLLLKNIPPATKTLFFEVFKNQALAGLQQRDGEPEAAYRVRRANGESLVDLIDMIANNGEEITLGGLSNTEDHTSHLELEINGTKDSGLAKFCENLGGRRSYFEQAVNTDATFTFNLSLQLDEKRRKPLIETFRSATEAIAEALRSQGKSDATAAQTSPFFQQFQRTAEEGHLDFFLQLAGGEPGEYHFLGGVRVVGNSGFPAALVDLLKFGKETVGGLAEGEGQAMLDALSLDDSKIGDYGVHVLPMPTPPDDVGKLMLGELPNLYLCATPQALWFAIGQKSALERLTEAVKRVEDPAPSDAPKRASTPVLFATHGAQWVDVGLGVGANPEESKFVGSSVASFLPEADELRITGRPTDRGFRLRMEMQSGYVGWIGRLISDQVDEFAERSVRREERRQRIQDAPPAQ